MNKKKEGAGSGDLLARTLGQGRIGDKGRKHHRAVCPEPPKGIVCMREGVQEQLQPLGHADVDHGIPVDRVKEDVQKTVKLGGRSHGAVFCGPGVRRERESFFSDLQRWIV